MNLKMEQVWRRDYANREEALRDVTDYWVGFYNSQRSLSKLGYLSPNGYERKMAEKHPLFVSEKNLTTIIDGLKAAGFEVRLCNTVRYNAALSTAVTKTMRPIWRTFCDRKHSLPDTSIHLWDGHCMI